MLRPKCEIGGEPAVIHETAVADEGAVTWHLCQDHGQAATFWAKIGSGIRSPAGRVRVPSSCHFMWTVRLGDSLHARSSRLLFCKSRPSSHGSLLRRRPYARNRSRYETDDSIAKSRPVPRLASAVQWLAGEVKPPCVGTRVASAGERSPRITPSDTSGSPHRAAWSLSRRL